MFENSVINIEKIYYFANITTLKYMPKHNKRCTCQLYGHYSLINKMVVLNKNLFCKDTVYIWYINITCKGFCHWKAFLHFLWAGENPFRNHIILLRYFDVILLSDVI